MKLSVLYILPFIILVNFYCSGQETSYTDSLKSLLRTDLPDSSRIKILNDIGMNYYSTDMNSATYYINQAVKLVREKGDRNDKAMTYRSQGFLYYQQGKYLAALELLDLAESLLPENPNRYIQADIYYIKGLTLSALQDFDGAFFEAERAFEVHELTNNLRGKYIIYWFLSALYGELGDIKYEMDYLYKSYDLIIQLNDTSSLGAIYNNIGTIYFEMNNLDSAKIYFQKSIELSLQYINHHWLGISYYNLAEIFYENGQLDSADHYNQLSVDLLKKDEYWTYYWNAINYRAKITLAKKDTLQAKQYYNIVLGSFDKNEDLKSQADALYGLFQISLYSDKPNQAMDYLTRYQVVNDSIVASKYTSLLSVLKIKKEYEDKQNKLELEHQKVELISQRKNFYLILLSIVILLLAITTYFVIRLQRTKAKSIQLQKKQLEQELEYKNKEMTSNVMSLMKKNEILSKIANKLLFVEKEATKQEVKSIIHQLSREIQKTTDKEIWDEFELRFNQVHLEFHENLMKEFPELSPNEQRLCAFLRLNMSTKDISNLTGQSAKAIDIARFRLRKKLGISNFDINLITFLSKY